MWFAALFSGENGKLIRKIAVWSIILTILVVVILIVSRSIKKNRANLENQQKIQQYESEIQNDKLSFSNSEYQSMADKVYKAVKGVGTDEDAIFEVFQRIRTNSDVLKLKSVFGVRDGMDLDEWIQDDLSDEDIDQINGYLRQRNISITF